MVVTEALARGLPVVAAEVGGVPEALGHGAAAPGPGCWFRPTTRPRSATRSEPGSRTGTCAGACAGRRANGARRSPGGRRPQQSSPTSSRGGAMTVEAIRVAPAWLDLREGADAAARARELVGHLRRRLPAGHRQVVHDLACGSGAMGRWLAPLLSGAQRWVLHDRDADLLALAAADAPGPAADGAAVTVETRLSDVTKLGRDDLAGATLITASALLDLLTGDELAALIRACAGAGSRFCSPFPSPVASTSSRRTRSTPAWRPRSTRTSAA